MSLQLKMLGTFEARSGGSEQLSFPTSKAKGLFAYLALERDQPHSREKLSNLFWGSVGDDRAQTPKASTTMTIRSSFSMSTSCLTRPASVQTTC